MRNRLTSTQRGFSMTEVIVSSLLVGGVVAGALTMTGRSVHNQSVNNELAKGPSLAEALLIEIMAMPYYDPESGSGENTTNAGELTNTRYDFDDVGDFHQWSSSTVQDFLGNPLSGFTGWSRSATVRWVDPSSGSVVASETGLKRIKVTVTSPTGIITRRNGLRFDEGTLENVDSPEPSLYRLISTTIELGSPAVTVSNVTNMLNPIGVP